MPCLLLPFASLLFFAGEFVPLLSGGSSEEARDVFGDLLPKKANSRLGTSRWRPSGWTRDLAFSPNGKAVASVTGKGTLSLWDRETGIQRDEFIQQNGGDMLVHSGGGQYISVGGGANITVFKTRLLISLVTTLPWRNSWPAFCPDDSNLIVAGVGKQIVFWDLRAGASRREIPIDDEVCQMLFSPDGKWLAAVGGTIYLYKTADYKLAGTINRGYAGGGLVVFAPDSRTVVSSDGSVAGNTWPRAIHFWDVATQKLIRTIPGTRGHLAYSPDGKYLAVAGDGIALYDPQRGSLIRRLDNAEFAAFTVAFSPDSKRLLAGSYEHCIRVWDVATGEELATCEAHRGTIFTVAYSPDGKTIASYSADQDVRLWDPVTGKSISRFSVGDRRVSQLDQPDPLPRKQASVIFTPDGKQIAALGGCLREREDPRILLCDLEGKQEGSLSEPKHTPFSLAIAPDGDTLAAGIRSGVRVWSIRSRKERCFFPLASSSREIVTCADQVAFSPDGQTLAARTRSGEIHLWDWPSGRYQRALTADKTLFAKRTGPPDKSRFINMQFSPDGKILLASENHPYYSKTGDYPNNTLYFYDTATWELIRTQKIELYGARAMAFSPDQRILATADPSRNDIHVWNAATGESLGLLSGHRGGVWSLTFSPDGTRLASGSADTTALVWDMTSFAAKLPASNPSAAEFDELWSELDAGGVQRAYKALWALAGAGDRAVRFLAAHVEAARPVDAERVQKLLADLGSEEFAVRDKATRQLRAMGKVVAPLLEKHLASKPPAEVRQRVEGLLANLPFGRTRQALRAVQVLEAVGTPAATELLRKLAAGADGDDVTRDAKAALQRRERRLNPR
jgi:WD40 repeat protein